jgi:phytanoyl-CoA hydroxylase
MAPSRVEPPQHAPTVRTAESPRSTSTLKPAVNDQYGAYYPADPETLNLESNFGPMDPGSVGYLQSTSVDTPLEIMHERFERDGYLFVCRLSHATWVSV